MVISFKEMGLRIQFGHRDCVKPDPGHEGFVVLDVGYIHLVAVDFCSCDCRYLMGSHEVQLLRRGWYPASVDSPKTCATFHLLDNFHAQTLQGKTTMYDFYTALERLTDATSVKPLDRYRQFLRMTREWRHLKMLKRGGRGHDPTGVNGTQAGDLAVRCPACPRPGINLPEGWENAPAAQKFLYYLFLALDACFRLKRRLVSNYIRDPGLGTGWSYFVVPEPYRQFLLTVTDQVEVRNLDQDIHVVLTMFCRSLPAVVWRHWITPTRNFPGVTARRGLGWGFARGTSSCNPMA